MGQTIGWYKWDGRKTHQDDDAPDWFWMKFRGRWEWFLAIFDAKSVEVDVDSYTGDFYTRPTDWEAFREKLAMVAESPEQQETFNTLTAYLEQHPDVYVNFG